MNRIAPSEWTSEHTKATNRLEQPKTIEHLIQEASPWDTTYTVAAYRKGDRVTFCMNGRISTGIVTRDTPATSSTIEITEVSNRHDVHGIDVILLPRRNCDWITKNVTLHRGLPGEVLIDPDNDILYYNEIFDIHKSVDIDSRIAIIPNNTQILPLEHFVAINYSFRGRRQILLEEGLYLRFDGDQLPGLSEGLYRIFKMSFQSETFYILISERSDVRVLVDAAFIDPTTKPNPTLFYQDQSTFSKYWKTYPDKIESALKLHRAAFPTDDVVTLFVNISQIMEIWSLNGFVQNWDQKEMWFNPSTLSKIYQKMDK